MEFTLVEISVNEFTTRCNKHESEICDRWKNVIDAHQLTNYYKHFDTFLTFWLSLLSY